MNILNQFMLPLSTNKWNNKAHNNGYSPKKSLVCFQSSSWRKMSDCAMRPECRYDYYDSTQCKTMFTQSNMSWHCPILVSWGNNPYNHNKKIVQRLVGNIWNISQRSLYMCLRARISWILLISPSQEPWSEFPWNTTKPHKPLFDNRMWPCICVLLLIFPVFLVDGDV